MGILDGLEPIRASRSCKTRNVLESLDEKDRKVLEQALADPNKWTSYALSKALGERGIIIKSDTLKTHRRGECSCLRT
jgi:L-ribulose-5-phosphate 3-epimerase UlaE